MYSFTVGLPVSRPVSDASTHTIYKGSSSRFGGVRYIFCWGTAVMTHTHTHAHTSFHVKWEGSETGPFCVSAQDCRGTWKSIKKKLEIKSEKRMWRRKPESTADSRLLTEAARRSARVRNKREQMKGRAMGDKRWALTEKHSRESKHAPI